MIILVLSLFQIESHLTLLEMLLVGNLGHDHIRHVLNAVVRLGGSPVANRQANNRHEPKSAVTATPSTSAAPLSTSSCGRRATTSTSTSAAKGRGQRATTLGL